MIELARLCWCAQGAMGEQSSKLDSTGLGWVPHSTAFRESPRRRWRGPSSHFDRSPKAFALQSVEPNAEHASACRP